MEDNKQELQVDEAAEKAPEAEQPEAEATETPAPAEQALTEELAEIDLSEVDMPEQDFDLDDILKEFGNGEAASVEEVPEAAPADPMAGDTVRLDTVAIRGAARNAAPLEEEDEPAPAPMPAEDTTAFTGQWEPEYEQPMGEYVPQRPILFKPKNRIRELKRKLVAGPEQRYYKLAEIGVGKLQAAIFLSVLVVLISAASTVLFAMEMVPESRLRLMIFGQCLAMMVSALLGSFQLIEGVTDLFKKGFTLNTMLLVTFIVCCVDAVFCLQQLRVPCCAAFSLEVTMALWSAYHRRSAEMGQMDALRKASRLDNIRLEKGYYEGRKGFLRGEGQVEDFMDHYQANPVPEKIIGWYALGAMLVTGGIAVAAGMFHGVYEGIRVAAVGLLAAVPVTGFVAYSRPFAVLVRRLHGIGTVLCGWGGVKGLGGKAVFPVGFDDLFPAGTTKIHGVKFFGSRSTDQIVAYCTAMIVSSGSGLAPVFTQVLESRNGRHIDALNLRVYDNGGIGGEVFGESVLVGSLTFLKEMGVEVPEGIRVSNAICIAIDGELCGLFAVTYDKVRSASAGLKTLCSCRGLKLVITAGDCMLDNQFIRSQFGIKSKRILFPPYADRAALQQTESGEDAKSLLLTTREGLLPYAYGVAGARLLRKSCAAGVVIHMLGGIVGMGIMLTLTLLGRLDLLTPVHMFAYQLLWLIPGFLATTWTRSL